MLRRSWTLAVLLLAVSAAPAWAGSATVQLRVEGKDRTLFEGKVRTDAHVIDQGDKHPCDGTEDSNGGSGSSKGPTLTTALDDSPVSWDADWNDDFKDFFVTRIGPDDQSSNEFWGLALNFHSLSVGGCQRRVDDGDEVLFAFDFFRGDFSEKTLLKLDGPESVTGGEEFTVRVRDGDRGNEISDAEVGGERTNGSGDATLCFDSVGKHELKATASGSIRSNRVDVDVADGTKRCENPSEDTTAPLADGVAPEGPLGLSVFSPKPNTRYAHGPRAISGRVAAAGPLLDVYVKLRRVAGGHCAWYSAKREGFGGSGHCTKARFNRLGAAPDFSMLLGGRLPSGRYILDVKALTLGLASSTTQTRFSVR